jgi:uncharacterized protein YecE (DUF72 family)
VIRVGIGGWSYAPWRGVFYPKGLPQARELDYASRALTSIEINATFYRTQSPASFAKWRGETPADFVFSVKAPRYVTHRKTLAEAGEPIERFLGNGIDRLGAKLGPILWQLDARKRFDAADMAAFLKFLPKRAHGRRLRHALDVRHDSFRCAEFVRLARRHGVAIACDDADEFAAIADVTADFVYARLMRSRATEPFGYPTTALDAWARRAQQWAAGGQPADLPCITPAARARARDVFIYVIAGAKERAPAAAQALAERIKPV